MPPNPKPIEDRFWPKVLRGSDDECWPWQGAHRRASGYGKFYVGARKVVEVHRFAYEYFNGPIPAGYDIDHLCRNRLCVNPAHLEAVTHRENCLRGNGWAGRNARKTHCPQGHEYTPENTDLRQHRTGATLRSCKTCSRAAKRRGRVEVAALVTLALLLIPATAGASGHARTPTYAGVCDFEHRMDIEIIDGIWWECRCYALTNGWDCAWVELPEPAIAPETRKRIKPKPHHRSRVVVRYALPAVTR